jgi:DNA-binding Lrp family transcriptional regulator
VIKIENGKISILLIEDNKADIRLIQELLKKASDFVYEVQSCIRLAEGLELLKNNSYDIMLLDLTLPDSDRISTLKKMLEYTSLIPIIILTGLDDKEIALDSLKKGIQDYLVKGEITTNSLARSILYAIERNKTKSSKGIGIQTFEIIIDEKDKVILNTLQENYKISYKEIGDKAELAASTVHTRVQNMINKGIIKKLDTFVDPFKVGYNTMAIVNLAIEPIQLDEISKKLSLLDEIQLVATTAGEYNLILKMIASNEKDLWRFINENVLVLKGIKPQINVSSFIDIYKNTQKVKFKIKKN